MFWKKARTLLSVEYGQERDGLARRGLLLPLWDLEELGCPENICGFQGSATWIKSVENVKLTAREPQCFDLSDAGIKGLVNELRNEHII